MHWYLVYTKIRQEAVALTHLQRQGYPCFLPMMRVEKVRQKAVHPVDVPLFPRYVFVRLGTALGDKAWGPIRSTQGVLHMVRFGTRPALVSDELIEWLKLQEQARRSEPQRLFEPGERVVVTHGPFAGFEGVYQMRDGQQRVMVLIEWMSRTVQLPTVAGQVRRVG